MPRRLSSEELYSKIKSETEEKECELITTKNELIDIINKSGNIGSIMIKFKVKMICNHEQEICLKDLRRRKNYICNKCVKDLEKLTNEEFLKRVYMATKEEYTFLERYIDYNTSILVRHNCDECNNHIYKVSPNSFLSGQRCPACMRPNYHRDTKQFKQEVFELVGDEYEVLGEYINTDTRILMKHNNCGHEWYQFPLNFIRGQRCPQCNRPNFYRDTEQFKREVDEMTNGEYTLTSEYLGDGEYVTIRHNSEKCNYYEHTLKATNFIQGQRCPICRSSHGENKIFEVLTKYNINKTTQYKFEDLIGLGKNKLKYDFAILDDNNDIVFLLEYDGKQHFCIIDHFGGEKGFATRVYHDALKNAYCEDNNIPLLRIPYWDKPNIEQILTEELSKYNLINIQQSQSA